MAMPFSAASCVLKDTNPYPLLLQATTLFKTVNLYHVLDSKPITVFAFTSIFLLAGWVHYAFDCNHYNMHLHESMEASHIAHEQVKL